MILSGRSPGGAGIVDQNIDMTEMAKCRCDKGRYRLGLAQIGSDRGCGNTHLLQMRDSLVELILFT